MTNFVKFIIFFLVIFGCSKSKKEQSDSKQPLLNKISLKIQQELLIEIDSTTSSYPESVQLFNVNGKKSICTYDNATERINFYNISSRKEEKATKILREGPKGIGLSAINGIYIFTMDSIFVASGQNIFLINSRGEVFYKINIPEFLKDKASGMPLISTESAAFYDGERFFVKCFTDKDAFNTRSFEKDKSSNLIIINLKSGKIDIKIDYPDVYKKGIYGMNFLMSSQTYNSLSNDLIISFPAYEKLLKYNLKTGLIVATKTVESKYFSQISPMEKIQKDYDYYTRFFIQSPSYGGIHFDKKNKYYYRIALRGRSTEDYVEGKFWKKASIIILNDNFERIGEFDLNETYSNSLLFVDNGLLYLIKESKSENLMSFDLLTPIEL